jgi:hypothetical protein
MSGLRYCPANSYTFLQDWYLIREVMMELSRRREKELHKLGDNWQGLWLKQRDLLEDVGELIRASGHQAAEVTREEVYPRAKQNVARAVRPVLDKVPALRREPEPPKKGAGAYLLMVVGAVALAGVAYAVWQTLRADDDLWVEEDDEAL